MSLLGAGLRLLAIHVHATPYLHAMINGYYAVYCIMAEIPQDGTDKVDTQGRPGPGDG